MKNFACSCILGQFERARRVWKSKCLEQSFLTFGKVFEKHMRNCQMSVVQRNTFTYHMEEMTGNTFIYI